MREDRFTWRAEDLRVFTEEEYKRYIEETYNEETYNEETYNEVSTDTTVSNVQKGW